MFPTRDGFYSAACVAAGVKLPHWMMLDDEMIGRGYGAPNRVIAGQPVGRMHEGDDG